VSPSAEEFAMIEAPCSQCGATLLAEGAWAGKKVKCPDCGGRTLLGPSLGEAVTVAPAPPAEAVAVLEAALKDRGDDKPPTEELLLA
jgi:DNA-directed RNA polymerase subunit RPC12/RpoP